MTQRQIAVTVFNEKEITTTFEGITMSINRVSRLEDPWAWEIGAHAHLNFEFHYIFDGKGSICLGNNKFEISKGQFYICAPFIDHSQATNEKDSMKEYCIECKLDFADADEPKTESMFFAQLTTRLLNSKFDDRNGYLLKNFRLLDELMSKNGKDLSDGDSTLIKSLLMSTVLSMLVFARTDSDLSVNNQDWNDINFKRASAIRNFLEVNYKNNVTVKDCTRILFMSERQIDRILNKVFQESFHGLLTHIRVNMAVNLIRTTGYSMERVASEAGFSSYRQMLRSFKKYNIEKPVSLRKQSTFSE